jgi:hypothetical protein
VAFLNTSLCLFLSVEKEMKRHVSFISSGLVFPKVSRGTRLAHRSEYAVVPQVVGPWN